MLPTSKGANCPFLANEMKAEAYCMGLWEGFYFPGKKRLAHLAGIINPFAISLPSFIPV